MIRKIIALLSIAVLYGCNSTALYNPTYISSSSTPGQPLDGKVLILTARSADDLFLNQSPSSFTGGGSKLNMEIGNMVRQIAKTKFEKIFKDGADMANNVPPGSEYVVVVTPELRTLDYQYNQLDNLGFAITPKVQVVIGVSAKDKSGIQKLDQVYDSGLVQGDSYIFQSNPGEQINRVLHDALSHVLGKAAEDVYHLLND